jgi:tetratricopeptide (TPR) repeat protein
MKDFFASYNKADREWAEWIAWELEEAGYSTVLQAWDFGAGSNFVLEMQKAASEAERTIAVLSPDYLASRFTQPEWAAAFAQDPTGEKRLLIPVRVRECDVKGLLGPIVYIDLVGLDEVAAKARLLAEVQHERRKPAVAPRFPVKAETPRFPGALPSIWNVPHRRNLNFTGRGELLESLHAALTSGRTAAVTQAISGLGGVGKTQLAVEYAYRHLADYSIVWWVRAEEASTRAGDLAGLAVKLGVAEKDARDVRAGAEAARDWLGHNSGWLLVFDNAPGPSDCAEYLPQGSTGHVIVTSRNPNWRGVAEAMPVKVLPREMAVEFLMKRTGQDDRRVAEELCEALGDLPLALEQAGAYIESSGITLAEYQRRFQQRSEELFKAGSPPVDYPHTIATTWRMALDQLKKDKPAALDLLRLFAFLAPDDIPRDLVEAGKADLPGVLAETAADPLRLDDALAALRRYSLVEVSGDSCSVHRLVQAVTRADLGAEGSEGQWAEAAARTVNNAFPFKEPDVATWGRSERLLPHALAAAGHAEGCGAALEAAGRLFNQAGGYLHLRAQLDEAEGAFRRSLVIAVRNHGPDHELVGTVTNNIGTILQDKGDLDGALRHTERALAIDEKVHGPDHPNVARDANNIGAILRDKGDLDGALRYTSRALAIDEKAYGCDHTTVAALANNIGQILRAKGDLDGALRSTERALAIDEKAFGSAHPMVAIFAGNIGTILWNKGDLDGALRFTERALTILERVYGADHPKTRTARHNLRMIEEELAQKKKG